jgi:hypothetical protein
MAVQLSVAVRNARLDQIESTIGATAKLYLFSGAVPVNCAAADPSGLLATLTLPADWMNDAATGSKTLKGVWTGTGSGAGVAASFRIKDNAGSVVGIQGTVTLTSGGGDLTLDNTNIAVAQVINITTFTLTDSNA